MNIYENEYKKEKIELDINKMQSDLNNTQDWEVAYWIGKCFSEKIQNSSDKAILEAFKKAFRIGLNRNNDFEAFMDATKIMAQLCFKYKNYAQASNYLMLLAKNDTGVPDWVHLYYATSQMYTQFKRIYQDPKFFFKRLEQVNLNNADSQEKRNAVFKNYLNLCVQEYTECFNRRIAIDEIVRACVNFGLTYTEEFINFQNTCCPEIDVKTVAPSATTQKSVIILPTPSQLSQLQEMERELEALREEKRRLQEERKERIAYIEKLENQSKTFADQQVELVNTRKNLEDSAIKIHQQEKAIDELLKANCVANSDSAVFQRKQKLLIVGENKKESALRAIASEFGFEKDNLTFINNYDKIKKLADRIQWNSPYAGIIFGALPHKTTGADGYSSLIQKCALEEGYPHVEEARTEAGELRLTNEAFRKAVRKMAVYLQSVDLA